MLEAELTGQRGPTAYSVVKVQNQRWGTVHSHLGPAVSGSVLT